MSARGLLLLGLLGTTSPALAQLLPTVYQGYATDDAGAPLTGDFTLFFSLYPSATGGIAVGTTMVPSVSIGEGSFAVELPSDPATLAGGDWWMAVSVVTAGNELSPRHHLGAVPFALRGGVTAMVAGQGPGTLQPAIAPCAPGSAIRVVNADGTVMCEPDAGEAGTVSSVSPGNGLTASSATGDVIMDLLPGTGLQIDAFSAVEMILGPGLATSVSRSDHDHIGQHWPAGTVTACSLPEKVTAIDPFTGNVACGPDAQTLFGVFPGGNLNLDAGNTFHLNNLVSIPGRMRAGAFEINTGPWTSWVSLHPTDFDPGGASTAEYTADFDGPGQVSFGFAEVFAPLHLPDGAFVTELAVVVAKPFDEVDQIFCSIYQNDLNGGGAQGMAETGCYGGDFCFGPTYYSTPAGFTVNNLLNAYTASCELSSPPFSVELYSYRVTYQYSEILP